jgi:hypothetical protein
MVDLFGSGIKNKKLAQEENVRKPVKGLVHKGPVTTNSPSASICDRVLRA